MLYATALYFCPKIQICFAIITIITRIHFNMAAEYDGQLQNVHFIYTFSKRSEMSANTNRVKQTVHIIHIMHIAKFKNCDLQLKC